MVKSPYNCYYIYMDHIIRHLFIINPKSFWNKSKQNHVVAKIHQFFKLMEDSSYDIHVSRFPRDAAGFIPIFAASLPEGTVLRVYAVGGDGILFDCLNGIMGLANVELAVIPYGHTNCFIRGFGKNAKTLFRVLSRQYEAKTVPMDVMRCGRNYALNYCEVGVGAESIRHAEIMRRQLEGGGSLKQWLYRGLYTKLYWIATAAATSNKQLMNQRYTVAIDGEQSTGTYQTFSVFNGPYYCGSIHPASHAMPNDGILNILTMRIRGILGVVLLLPSAIWGYSRVFSWNRTAKRGRKITIRSETMLQLCMDDIVFFEPEIEIEILPSAVQFVDASLHGYKGGRQ